MKTTQELLSQIRSLINKLQDHPEPDVRRLTELVDVILRLLSLDETPPVHP